MSRILIEKLSTALGRFDSSHPLLAEADQELNELNLNEDVISIQEAWEACGGNPGIKATKAELIEALKQLDSVCDEADQAGLAG